MSAGTGKEDEPPIEVEGEVVPASGGALVKASSAALAADLSRAREFRRHTRAEKTERVYAGAWARFQAWAAAKGVPTLPAPPAIVEMYAGHLASEGCRISTLEQFLSAGTYYHRAAGYDFPRSAPDVRETLKGIRSKMGAKRVKRAPLALAELATACGQVESLRDRAMLTVGWFCALRSANLVKIRREHVRLVRVVQGRPIDDAASPNGLILYLPRSKTDQHGEGAEVAVVAQDDKAVCPVHALMAYFGAVPFEPSNLIFPVSERTVSRLVKRLVADAEHGHKTMREIEACASCAAAAHRFGSHSLRRGVATEMAQAGVEERAIMRQGKWTSERVARGYMDDATLFENNPTKGLSARLRTSAPSSPQPPQPSSPAPSPAPSRAKKRRRSNRQAFHGR
jgi:integrase